MKFFAPINSRTGIKAGLLGCSLWLIAVTMVHAQLAISTMAGYPGKGSTDGVGGNALFLNPQGVAVDMAGNVYVADTGNNTIRIITAGGVSSTLAGSVGVSGSTDGTGSSALFNQPSGIALDNVANVSNIYVTDYGNSTIRQINLSGQVTTVAGSAGVTGSLNSTGTNSLFFHPLGIAVDNSTNLYVADYGNHLIRKIEQPALGHILVATTLAGSAGVFGTNNGMGTSAQFYNPEGVAVDQSSNVYVADTGNAAIRFITPAGLVSTLAGSPGKLGQTDSTGTNALFYQPIGIAIDSASNLYVADYFNNTIRQISSAGVVVTTLAGLAGTTGSADGANSSARFWGPQGVAVSSAGTVYIADTGNSTIRTMTAGVVTTMVGSSSVGSSNGVATGARLYSPQNVASDSSGNVYVADTQNSVIRKITPAGVVSLFAGSVGVFGSEEGTGSSVQFSGPQGVAVDSSGNVYVADTGNYTIRKLTSSGASSTFAGSAGNHGNADGTGTAVQFYEPIGVAVDSSGNVYVADTWNHTIRKLTPGGVSSTLAGEAGVSGSFDGTNAGARFNCPTGVALDSSGNIYVTDYNNDTIRKVTPAGVVTTLAGLAGSWGSADGAGSNALFFGPTGITVDGSGNLFVIDSGNNAVRKITNSLGNWVSSTVAGLAGVTGSADGTGPAAEFNYPAGVSINSAGYFFVADAGNNTVRTTKSVAALTWTPAPLTYGTALGSGQLNASSSVAGAYAYTPTAGTILNAGTYALSVILTPTDPTDNSGASGSVSLVVSPASLTVTVSNATTQYGTAIPTFTGTITGLTNGDNITATYSCSATTSSPAGTYSIVPILADPDNRLTNYAVTTNYGILTIAQVAPVLTWTTPAPVTYGTPLGANQLNASSNVPGTFAYTPSTGTVLNAGTNTLSVLFTPTDTTDYTTATDTVSLVVTPVVLTVTASNAARAYGQTNPSFGGAITGLQNGDNITATYSCSATSNSPVGPYAIMPSLVDPNNRATNYTVALNNGTLTVGQATPMITWTNPAPITYGSLLTTNQLNASSNTPGTFTYTPTNDTVLNAGTNSLSVLFTPTDSTDYTSTTATVSLVVTPAVLTVTASNAARDFGIANPSFGGMITGLTNSDNITATYSTAATLSSPAGTYSIVPSFVDPDSRLTNYTVATNNGLLTIGNSGTVLSWGTPLAITYGTPLGADQLTAAASTPGTFTYTPTNGAVLNAGTNTLSVLFTPTDTTDYTSATDTVSLVVTPAGLTVTASNATRAYGQSNPSFGGMITGLSNNDNITATYNCSATSNSPVGTYNIVPSFVDPDNRLTNYMVTNNYGTLTITQAVPVLTWATPAPITYGTALGANQLNATSNTSGTFVYTPTGGTVLDTGSQMLSVEFTPANTNYTSATTTVSLVVTPAILTVTASNAARNYGHANPSFGGTITGLTNNDNITATYSCSATPSSPVGTYAIVPSLVDPDNRLTNYIATTNNGTLTIGSSETVLSWGAPPSITYGTALGANQLNAAANTSGTFTYTPTNGTELTTGTHTLSVLFTPYDTTDYTNATATVSLVVTPAVLTVTGSNASRPYGQTNPPFGGMITGLQNGDNITATYSCSATVNSSAGPYAIVPTLVDPNNRLTNYTAATNNGTLTISRIVPVLSWSEPPAITYGTALDTNQLNATSNVSGTFSYTPTTGTVLGAGTNPLSVLFTPTDSTDYSNTTATVSLVVTPAVLTVTASNAARDFGIANPSFGGMITGLTNNDNITATYSTTATLSSPAGTYSIVPSFVDPDTRLTNYTVTTNDGTLTIGNSGTVLSWGAPPAITYGTALGADQLTAAANTPGSFVYTPTDGTVLNAGTNTLSVLFTPNDLIDYTTATATVSLVVTPSGLTVTASNATRAYGQSNPSFGGMITGLSNNDNITATYNCSATSTSPVGMYNIVPSFVDPDNRLTNYVVTNNYGTLTITQAMPVLAWATPAPITYGTALGANQLNASSNTTGTFVYTPTGGTVLDTGSQTLSVVFTPTDTTDYTSATDTVSLVVTPANLTVTASNAARAYGQANPSFGGTITGLSNNDNITATYSCSATLTSPVGPYAIVPSLVDPDNRLTNYIATTNNGTLTIGKSGTILSWGTPPSITYGTALGANQLNAAANTSGTFVYNLTNGTVLTVGTYTLSVLFTPNDTTDYTSATDTVSLVVSPANLTVTASNVARFYEQANPAFGGTITGLQNGDNITATYSCSATASSPAGTYAIVPSLVDPDNRATNYTVRLNNGTLAINIPPQIQVFYGTNNITNGETNSLNLGSVQQSANGVVFDFTVTNAGGLPLLLEGIAVPASYVLITNPPSTVAAGSNGSFSVQLIRANVGVFSGNISITNNDPTLTNGVFSFAVTGTVLPPEPQIEIWDGSNSVANGQTNAVDFAPVLLNQVGPIVSFTVSNTGEATLDLTNIAVPPGYVLVTNPPSAVAVGRHGSFSVQLLTTTIGSNSGNITITNNDPTNNPFVFPITGFVGVKTISMSDSLALGVVPIGSSKQATLIISNTGNTTLTVSNIVYPFASDFSGNWTGGQIAAGSSQSVTVTFSPHAAANYDGNVSIVSDAISGTNLIPVTAFGAYDSLVLKILTNGIGKVTPNDARYIKQKTKVSLTAVPGKGQVFASWIGSFNSTKNPLDFVMASNTIVQVNFIPNPYLPYVGTYNGLFTNTNGVTEQTAGMLKGLAIHTNGSYSGTLLINGTNHTFSGSFSVSGQAITNIPRRKSQGGPLTLAMTLLTSSNSARQVTGTVSGTNSDVPWVATLTADRATNKLRSAAYTMLILPDTNSAPAISPGGAGYALITNHAGTVTITGSLADGTPFSQSTRVSLTGDVPIYANLYKQKGLLLGWINLESGNIREPGLTWAHPPNSSGLFASEFTSTNPVELSTWVDSPQNKELLTTLTNLFFLNLINEPNASTTNLVYITATGKITGISGNMSGSIHLKTGLLTVTNGSGPDKTIGHGAILPNETNGGGYFLNNTNAGAIILAP